MRSQILIPLLVLTIAIPGWAQGSGPGSGSPPAPSALPSIVGSILGDLDTIGPDGTFYSARMRLRLAADTTGSTIPSPLPQQTTVRAIGVHDQRDPRWQTTVDGFPAGLVAGERNVYLAVALLPTLLPLGGTNTGSATPLPVTSAPRLILLNPANGAVLRTVTLAGGSVRSLELKKVDNNEFLYAVTGSPITILVFPPPPPSPILEIFDADGNRIKQVKLSAP